MLGQIVRVQSTIVFVEADAFSGSFFLTENGASE